MRVAIRHTAIRVVTAFAVVAVLVACEGSPSERPADAAAGPPGTQLMDGFVVAPGSRLVGPVFVFTEGSTDRNVLITVTARAIISIDRDPIAVYDRYVTQARRLGIHMRATGATDQYSETCRLNMSDRSMRLGTADPSKARSL